MTRIPGLDGLRAISIAIVLFAHVTGTAGFPMQTSRLHGWIGVHVFFVISGFLITSILAKELNRTGTISLRRFYWRRTLRLFPAAYAFIAAVALLTASGALAVPAADFAFAATYTSNYHTARSWSMGHLWSLAVEEQFYLLLPALLVCAGIRRATWVLVAVLAVSPVARLFQTAAQPALSFVVFADALAIGCLLAIKRDTVHRTAWYMRFRDSRWFAVVPVAAFGLAYVPSTKVLWLVSLPLMGVLIAACVDWAMSRRSILDWKPLVWIGQVSYSLYLWQQIFLNRESAAWWCAWPQNIVLAFGAALASYYLVERPVLALRDAGWRRPVPVPARARAATAS